MVIIYGDLNCVWCERAKDLCKQYDMAFTYKQIRDPGIFDELQEQAPGVRTVPQIFWHGKHIGGFNAFAAEIENTRNFGQEKI